MASTNQPEFFNLDWRHRIRAEALVQLVEEFWTVLDAKAKLNVHLSTSTAKALTKAQVSGHQHEMFLQRLVNSVKRYQGGSDASASKSDSYLARTSVVMNAVLQMIAAEEQNTHRTMWYKLRDGHFSNDQVKQVCTDLALSINVHPYQLGVVPEMGGAFVRVPNGMDLDVEEVQNIFVYHRVGRAHKTTYHGGGTTAIVPMYKSISVNQHTTEIRAVVVSEHRGIKDKLDSHANQPGFEGILLVLTGGFPDAGVREFLHLLAVNDNLEGVPFLFVSDCDVHALAIYTALKYGSDRMAYASPIMVCPQLVFVGLTADLFTTFARGHPDRYITSLKARESVSAADEARIRIGKEGHVNRVIYQLTHQPSSRLDKGSKERMRGLERTKVLELPNEDLALKQLQYFQQGGAIITLHRLDKFEQSGLALFLAQSVAAVRDETHQDPPLFGDLSQTRAAWVAAAGVHSSSQIPQPQSVQHTQVGPVAVNEMLLD